MKRILTLTLALMLFGLNLKAQVVIYEVYGGGGSTSAGPAYKNDYLVLLNKSSSSVSITGWSIQYASSTGPSTSPFTWAKADITGAATIAPYGFFLIKVSPDQNSSGTSYTGAVLPTADVTLPTSVSAGGLAMSATGGKVALVNDQVALVNFNPMTSNIVDLVGWGTTANFYEGTGAAPATTNTSAIKRINNGQDTNDNAADFALNTTPTPLNSSSPTIPVELIDFKAQKVNQAVKLLWSTATELNNAFYAIERSENGKSFDKIGEINGYGNSNVLKTYQFIDEKPMSTVNYYRLRQVDFDGKETVYKTVSVNFGKNTTTKVYPSIAKDKINVEVIGDKGVSDLLVVNLLGQVVKAQKLQNTEGVFPVNISDLPNGSYIMRLVSKNESVSQRFEKQ